MQQEMLDCELLSLLSLVAVTKWAELEADVRVFPAPAEDEEEINDDDIVSGIFIGGGSQSRHFGAECFLVRTRV